MSLWDEVKERTEKDADEFIELLKEGVIGRRKMNYPIEREIERRGGYVIGD